MSPRKRAQASVTRPTPRRSLRTRTTRPPRPDRLSRRSCLRRKAAARARSSSMQRRRAASTSSVRWAVALPRRAEVVRGPERRTKLSERSSPCATRGPRLPTGLQGRGRVPNTRRTEANRPHRASRSPRSVAFSWPKPRAGVGPNAERHHQSVRREAFRTEAPPAVRVAVGSLWSVVPVAADSLPRPRIRFEVHTGAVPELVSLIFPARGSTLSGRVLAPLDQGRPGGYKRTYVRVLLSPGCHLLRPKGANILVAPRLREGWEDRRPWPSRFSTSRSGPF
jgi:hypothetical protein